MSAEQQLTGRSSLLLHCCLHLGHSHTVPHCSLSRPTGGSRAGWCLPKMQFGLPCAAPLSQTTVLNLPVAHQRVQCSCCGFRSAELRGGPPLHPLAPPTNAARHQHVVPAAARALRPHNTQVGCPPLATAAASRQWPGTVHCTPSAMPPNPLPSTRTMQHLPQPLAGCQPAVSGRALRRRRPCAAWRVRPASQAPPPLRQSQPLPPPLLQASLPLSSPGSVPSWHSWMRMASSSTPCQQTMGSAPAPAGSTSR